MIEIKSLEETEMKILVSEGTIKLERMRNSLDEFEMNELEAKGNVEIQQQNNKDKVRKIIKHIEELKLKIEELGAMGASDIMLLAMRFLQHLSNSKNSNIILYYILTNSRKQANLDINHKIPKL